MIPILVAILVLSIFHFAFLSEFGNHQEETKYSQTESFANNYLYFFINKINQCQTSMKYNYFIELDNEEGAGVSYYEARNNYQKNQIGYHINYIIVEKETGNMYTNIKSNNYQETMQNMKKQKIYWNLVEGKIETNLTYLNEENIRYNYNFNYLKDTYKEEKEPKDYDIYSSFDEEKITGISGFIISNNTYNFMLQNRKIPIYTSVFSLLALLLIAIYLFWAIGYKKGKEGIALNTIDKIPYEIIAIISAWVLILSLALGINLSYNTSDFLMLMIYGMAYIVCYIACAVLGVTTIKRIKAKTFWKSFFSYKVLRWFYSKMKKFTREMKQKMPSSKKIFWYYWGYVVISILLATFTGSAIAIIVLLLFWLWVFYKIRKQARHQEEIKEALEKIYQGENNIYINPQELEGILKEMAIYINDIAGGFSNAIEESLKSERLKTELITNVSHDIKTPLTSIINYVDLLKKEDLQNEKVKEYINILDMKSQRLKNLTEDLVEASKVSSGNVKLNIEEIKLKELINQSIGEFKDRFEEKKLQIEIKMPEEEIKINADSRYFYRIIENLFSNITKYALENSRVYIDMKKEKAGTEISIKNISKEKLNITSDELMQRFVRGDKSRYTERKRSGIIDCQKFNRVTRWRV